MIINGTQVQHDARYEHNICLYPQELYLETKDIIDNICNHSWGWYFSPNSNTDQEYCCYLSFQNHDDLVQTILELGL